MVQMKRRVPGSLLTIATLALALTGTAAAAEPVPAKKASMVFVATTGLEDLQTLTSSLRHAKEAVKSGHLSKVTWLVYGRSVVAFDPKVKAVPESVGKLAREAAEAGVELVVCGNALAKFGIAPDKLAIKAKVVPNGVAELARLVAEGAVPIRY